MLPEVEDDDAAGVAAMVMAAKLMRGVEIVRRKEDESSGNSPSQQDGRKLWSAREQGDRSTPLPLFKYQRLRNVQIRNQRPDQIGPGILLRTEQDKC